MRISTGSLAAGRRDSRSRTHPDAALERLADVLGLAAIRKPSHLRAGNDPHPHEDAEGNQVWPASSSLRPIVLHRHRLDLGRPEPPPTQNTEWCDRSRPPAYLTAVRVTAAAAHAARMNSKVVTATPSVRTGGRTQAFDAGVGRRPIE